VVQVVQAVSPENPVVNIDQIKQQRTL